MANNTWDGDGELRNGKVIAKGIDAQGIPSVTSGVLNKGNTDHDPDKGVIQRSPNGHRWKMNITDAGVSIWTDLDA